jgi:2-(1,2-epoxy-1,2-dihydrophenyl)acetyl-CoA isomerase
MAPSTALSNAYECLQVTEKQGVVLLKLCRPDRLNAFSKTMHAELKQALKEIERFDGLRALVLTGDGRGFCAGQDLEERRIPEGQPKPDLGDSLKNTYSPLVSRLRKLPVPVVAAVNGVAAGAGAALALACDLVIAKRSAKFTFPFSYLGLIPDAGATSTLVRAVGQARAMAIVMLGEVVTGEQAAEWGLIWKAVDDESFDTEIHACINNLTNRPALGLELAKRSLYRAMDNDFESQLELESQCQKLAGRNPQYWEKVQQFLDKK